ncbi:sugar phosphate isomerase/epimerase [bacterium]|nr:sugar phosphate isomerase/epimerase [bacterium]
MFLFFKKRASIFLNPLIRDLKIGFRLSGFKHQPLETALKSIADCGYQAVELCLEHPDLNPENPHHWSAEQLKPYLRECNLEASAVSFHGKRAGGKEKREKCSYGMKSASDLGVKVFISGSFLGHETVKFEEMCEFTSEMCVEAEKLGIDFAVEPEPGTVIHNSEDMESLIDRVKNPRLKINLDIGHSYLTENDIFDDICKWSGIFVHTHIEDMKRSIHEHLIPGEGDLDFLKIFSIFRSIGYDGYFTIDLFDIFDNPESHARRAFKALETLLT